MALENWQSNSPFDVSGLGFQFSKLRFSRSELEERGSMEMCPSISMRIWSNNKRQPSIVVLDTFSRSSRAIFVSSFLLLIRAWPWRRGSVSNKEMRTNLQHSECRPTQLTLWASPCTRRRSSSTFRFSPSRKFRDLTRRKDRNELKTGSRLINTHEGAIRTRER